MCLKRKRVCLPVMRIHDILVWIRIRIWIRGSMPLTNDPDPDADSDPAIFVIDLQDANRKQIFLKVFLLITFTSFFIDKKSQTSHKAVVIKVFLTIFA
jgi:hypothetical protein